MSIQLQVEEQPFRPLPDKTEKVGNRVRYGHCSPNCGKCCTQVKVVSVPYDEEQTKFMELHGIIVQKILNGKATLLTIPIKCQWLGSKMECTHYDDRPRPCKEGPYGPDDTPEGCTYGWR